MKKTLYPFYSVLFLSFILLTSSIHAQTTELVYKTKGKTNYSVNIALSDDMGKTDVSPETFQKNDDIYFLITPTSSSRKSYFKDGDISDYFSKAEIHQDGERIKQSNLPSSFSDSKGKMNRVIISFPKKKIKLYEPFSFVNELGESHKIKIKETLLNSYGKYHSLYKQAKNLLNAEQATEAFKTLSKIRNDAQNSPEIKSFSFFESANQDLSIQAVKEYLDSISKIFSQKQKLFISNKMKPALDGCDSVLKSFKKETSLFNPFLESAYPKINKLKRYYKKVDQNMNSSYLSDRLTFKKANMALLETGNYSEYKFYLFVDVLSHMLCQTDSLQIIQGLRPININSLDKMPQKKAELINTGWINEFKTLISFLNDNISQKKMIFDASILTNLRRQDSLEHEPYYEIFTAFNNLDDNPEKFYTSLNNALVKCGDNSLLNDIDLWLVSFKMTHEGINRHSVIGINKGISAIKDGQWNDADNIFNVLKRQANQNPVPWFYSAVIQNHKNEVFSAQAQFSRALELYPHYLAPRQFLFDILASQKQFNSLLSEADSAISSFNIWYFNYIKAKALLNLNKDNNAINEILSKCIPMNKWEVKQYYLLGDAYLQTNNFVKAKEAYMQTRNIDPFSGSKFFNDKMKILIKKEQDYSMQQQKQALLKKKMEESQEKQQQQQPKQDSTSSKDSTGLNN